MPDSFLLVPGTGGCKLAANGQDLGYPVDLQFRASILGFFHLPLVELVTLLSMQHLTGQVAPYRTSLKTGTLISSGRLLDAAYNLVPAFFVPFSYDWRADIRHSAESLLDVLIARKPQDGKWRLISHSQGGLLLVVASKMFAQENGGDPNAFSRLVRDIVFIGVPFYGTLNAAHAIAKGEQLGERASSEFVNVVRSWPAVYQMLPTWRGSLLDPAGNPDPNGLLHADSWAGTPHVSPDLLARAQATRTQYLDDPMTDLGGIQFSTILSTNARTWDHAIRGPHGVEFPARAVDGDSLVPFEATVGEMSAIEVAGVKRITPETPVAAHSMLLNDDVVTTLYRRLMGI